MLVKTITELAYGQRDLWCSVNMIASSAVDRGSGRPCSGVTKDNIIDICCFSTKDVALRSKID